MRRTLWLFCSLLPAVLAGCADDSGGGCDTPACEDDCIRRGFAGGLCGGSICACIGGPDAGADDRGGDVATDAGGEESAVTWESTPGTQAAVDRTEPCTESTLSQWRRAPQDPDVAQSCLPNYYIWAPVVCGNPAPDCDCNASVCLAGEAAKPLNDGEFCVCLNLCETQEDSVRCGAANERDCIPVDDWSGTQVFICGGEI